MSIIANQEYLKTHQIQLNTNLVVGQMVGIKNLSHQYMAANDYVAECFGWSLNAMIDQNITDFQVKSDVAECADMLIFEDEQVISSGVPIQTIARFKYVNDKEKIIFGEKSPVKNEVGAIVGVLVTYFDLSHTPIINMHALLSLVDKKNIINEQFTLIIKDNYPNMNLTNRQNECLFYLMRGYSCSKISALLNLSNRTIEAYLELIKNKLNCENKQQIIEKAVCCGLLNIIPKSIFESVNKMKTAF